MRKVLVSVLLVLCICSAVFGAQRFRDFPAAGVCTGDYVRYRDYPDTESMILGRLYKGDRVTVVAQTSNEEGEVWYEIEHPEGYETTAWVSARYIRPVR